MLKSCLFSGSTQQNTEELRFDIGDNPDTQTPGMTLNFVDNNASVERKKPAIKDTQEKKINDEIGKCNQH